MMQEHRKRVAMLILWFVIANVLYFSNIKEVAHPCNEITGWLSLWVPFTFGIKDIFPYAIDTHSSPLENMLSSGTWFCSQNYLFDAVGYAYFLLGPVAIVFGSYFLYHWTFSKTNSQPAEK